MPPIPDPPFPQPGDSTDGAPAPGASAPGASASAASALASLATWANPIPDTLALHLASRPACTPAWYDHAWRAAQITGAFLGAWHGYRRNASIPSAVLWGVAGAVLPVVALPVALVQGLGQPTAEAFERTLEAKRRSARLARVSEAAHERDGRPARDSRELARRTRDSSGR